MIYRDPYLCGELHVQSNLNIRASVTLGRQPISPARTANPTPSPTYLDLIPYVSARISEHVYMQALICDHVV